MQGRKSGYFLVYRDVWKHAVFKNLIEASIWLYMISSASHKSRTLMFLDNPIAVNTGELIFPIRKNAKIWNISYSSLRTFLLRLKRRGMISTRLAQLIPTSNHPRRNITIINVINYDKFQYVDKDQPAQLQHSPLTNTQDTNKQLLTRVSKNKSSKDIVYLGDEFGEYVKIKTGGKIKWKHKFKANMPLKDKI